MPYGYRRAPIFFANPNAPSGTLVPTRRVRELATRFCGLLLVDEAYVDRRRKHLGLVHELPMLWSVHLEQRLRAGGAALRLCHRGTRGGGGNEQGQGQLHCDAVAVSAATAALADQDYAAAPGSRCAPSGCA